MVNCRIVVRLVIKNILFTLIVPGTVGVYLPLMLSHGRPVAAGSTFGIAIVRARRRVSAPIAAGNERAARRLERALDGG